MSSAKLASQLKAKLGPEIRRRREGKGWTQAELGGKARVTMAAISDWEREKKVPNTTNLVALAGAFGLTVEELLAAAGAETSAPLDAPAPPDADREAVVLRQELRRVRRILRGVDQRIADAERRIAEALGEKGAGE